MLDRMRAYCAQFVLVLLVVLYTGSGAIAQDAAWHVGKSSGDVWVTTSGVQQASLTDDAVLNPGDNIRTGRNGRVLLVRGEETILISPNSAVGIPTEKREGLSTTILQQAGSILLEVEKRNVKHFEVETPYLAAVVKGTHFRVSVNKYGSKVDVLRGRVEVADFKTGQFALVLPNQAAQVAANGKGGLSLSGSGTFNPIQQGKPRAASVKRIPVPKAGLPAPRAASNGRQVRALGNPTQAKGNGSLGRQASHAGGQNGHAYGATRITSPVGEVNLDFPKVTKGLARAATVSGSPQGKATGKTVWNSDGLTPGNGAGKAYGQGNGNGGANGNASANAKGGNGNANGNGNGNGNGSANANAHSNGNGKGKGNS